MSITVQIVLRISIAASSLLVVACSTTPTSTTERRLVPAERIVQQTLTSRSGQRGAQLTITRDHGFTGSATGVDVFLDGGRIARLATGESITIFATAGQHLIGARYSWGPAPPVEREFILSAASPKSVRVTIDQSGNLDIKAESGLL